MRVCGYPGCSTVTDQPRCPAHQARKLDDARRGNEYRKRYKTPAWRRLRLAIAERDGWICQICHEPITRDSDLHCDHITPVTKGGTDDPANLRSTHHGCHSKRTRRDQLRRI